MVFDMDTSSTYSHRGTFTGTFQSTSSALSIVTPMGVHINPDLLKVLGYQVSDIEQKLIFQTHSIPFSVLTTTIGIDSRRKQ